MPANIGTFTLAHARELEYRGRVMDVEKLATNFVDIISDCAGLEDFDPTTALQNYSELAVWLMNTSFANTMRRRSLNPQIFHRSNTEGVEWEMDMPGFVYTLDPTNSGDDCCFTMPDFAKCSKPVPMDMLCLKDCDNIFDTMVFERLRINERTDLAGIARSGETLETVNNRIRHLWMAFYTLHTMILGTRNTSDNITKPFHGLLEVMQNAAVTSMSGANVLGAFASLGCRLDVLGGDGVFALNPILYRSIESAVKPDENGNLPDGWTRVDGKLRFHGRRFIEDKLMPVNMDDMTGDIWVLDGGVVGAFLFYNVGSEKEVSDEFTETAKADGCGRFCHYLYNAGTVANNDANRLMVISGVPISSECASVADLASLINPQTLIPRI